MNKFIWIVVALFCCGGMAAAANVVALEINATNDTISAGQANEIQISLENDIKLGAVGMGFKIWSTNGVSWTWDDQETVGLGDSKAVTVVPGSRMDPPGTIWDLGGLQVTEQNFDGASPDTLHLRGAASIGGMAVGPLQHIVSLHFTPVVPTPETIGLLCIDSVFVPPAGPFVFVSESDSTFIPTVSWNEGGQCYIVAQPVNDCPLISGPTTLTVNHCGQGNVQLSATDNEPDVIIWGIASNSGNGTATINNGNLTYTPSPADVGSAIVVMVFATDAFHDPTGCSFHEVNIAVTNNAPEIAPIAYIPQCFDLQISKIIIAADADPCDDVTVDFAPSFTPIGDMAIDPTTGEFTWTTSIMDVGIHTIDVVANDGMNMATSSFYVEILSCEWFAVQIDKIEKAPQGHFVDLPIRLTAGSDPLAGFDLLMHYDNSILTFSTASLGAYFANCGWEYFTYRNGWNGNCGSGCPSGEIRLIGLAETNNGPYHPNFNCLSNASGIDAEIANLTFFVTTDVNANGQFAQVKFFWMDCGDNSLAVPSGDTLAISQSVYNYYGDNGMDTYIDVTDNNASFPTFYGAPQSCIDQFEPGLDKTPPIRYVDFYNGGIDIIDKDEIDDRGDINMNGIANEIADAVMFTNFFIVGSSAFNDHVAGSTAASDINADGTALTVADLVYLVRVIIGDALPYPKPIPGSRFEAFFDGTKVSIDTDVDAGAALFVFTIDGTVGAPTINNNMDIVSHVDGNELRVLVYNIGTEAITSGAELTIPVSGTAELVEVEAATYSGAVLESSIRNLPRTFTAYQNHPNPFNPTTTISFDLNVASDWKVDVYNITGQKVTAFSGFSQPGTVSVEWDATDQSGHAVASGIYFYKISAGSNSATMKMVLMK